MSTDLLVNKIDDILYVSVDKFYSPLDGNTMYEVCWSISLSILTTCDNDCTSNNLIHDMVEIVEKKVNSFGNTREYEGVYRKKRLLRAIHILIIYL